MDDDGDDGDGGDDGPAALVVDGFPVFCPVIPDHPEFEWPGRGNGDPISRRKDFERSISNHISLSGSRNRNLPRGYDIDSYTYSRIKDNENKKTCRYLF